MLLSFFSSAINEADLEQMVLVLFFQEGRRSPFFNTLLSGDLSDFNSLLSSPIEDYFYYVGSLEVSIPPKCFEGGVSYAVVNPVLEISAEQIEQISTGPDAISLADAVGHGLYREVQPLNGRTLYHRVPGAATASLPTI